MKQKIPELDGFRAIAILLVLNLHFSIYTGVIPGFNAITYSGWFGVDLFFVLSGFLLTLPYIKAGIEHRTLPKTWQFYKNRILRICPLYYFSLVVFVVSAYWFDSAAIKPSINDILVHSLFLHNYPIKTVNISPVYWSLAVEFQFYLLCPLLGFCLYYFLSLRQYKRLSLFLISLLIIPISYRFYAATYLNIDASAQNYANFIYVSTWSNFDAFVFGILGAIAYAYFNQLLKVISQYIWQLAFIASIVTIYVLMAYNYYYSGLDYQNSNLFNPVLFYSLLNLSWIVWILSSLALNNQIGNYWRQFLNSKIMAYLATISYSIYLWHLSINLQVTKLIESIGISSVPLATIIRLLLAISITLVVSTLTYFYIERPVLQLKQRQKKQLVSDKLHSKV